ncbi:septation protein SepH [Arthrobacter sp. SX1312]|uniref:septation protein SepH n=1 Tax=Arthrobacter sp. SX1312 TaxID=2058896 RepID=UPI000CE4C62B|nr:septation protein SepH [Arthrobacter sp. SX1312]
MQELRLVGVHEDGGHLLLSGEEGTSYRLPIDDALRRATTPADAPAPARDASPKETRTKPPKAPVHLTPRDIQARIRMGATAEQVAAESDLDLAHVQRYEGPVRAERDYLAYLAQRVEVASPLPSHDGYRSAFGDDPALLGDMVAYRVQSYGVDPASLEWDSWRRQDGTWHVEASFELPEGSTVDLGEQPPAQWTYNPTRKTVVNGNRWAQVLSELEPLDGPLPARRLSAVADRVFDFEAEKADEAPEPTPADQDGLLDVLRSRRGQRLGADEDGDDALAELLTRGGIPAAHPRVDDGTEDTGTSGTGTDEAGAHQDGSTERDAAAPGLALAPRFGDDDVLAGDAGSEEGTAQHEDGTPRLYDGVSTDTREISIFAQPSRRDQPPAGTGPDGSGRAARPGGRDVPRGAGKGTGRDAAAESSKDTGKDGAEVAAERRVKPKRSSVPSWDDIVFGRKND